MDKLEEDSTIMLMGILRHNGRKLVLATTSLMTMELLRGGHGTKRLDTIGTVHDGAGTALHGNLEYLKHN